MEMIPISIRRSIAPHLLADPAVAAGAVGEVLVFVVGACVVVLADDVVVDVVVSEVTEMGGGSVPPVVVVVSDGIGSGGGSGNDVDTITVGPVL